jgi:hypothetical protein
MTTFGAKESWMEPMNMFLNNHRNAFKKFLDDVCDVSSTTLQVNIPPSYSTPLAILNRLPPTSREGFPSLPHLIDHARSFATLVSLWLEHVGEMAEVIEEQTELLKFHLECLKLRKRTEQCLASAERAERPGSQNETAWDDIVGQLKSETSTLADEGSAVASTSNSQHTFFHARTDSSSTSPSTITSSSTKQQTYPPILGIRSNSTMPPADSPITSRQQWRGPGRQLSLEILPSSRSALVRDAFVTSTNSKSQHPQQSDAAGQQQAASPASNTTSPFGTSPFGGSEGSADEYPGKPSSSAGPSMNRSGRTTPSQYPRNAADVRIHPWSYSMAREVAMRGGRAAAGNDDAGHESSDGDRVRERKVEDAGSGVSGRWRIGPTGEHIFVKSKTSTPKARAPPKTAPATSAAATAADLTPRPDSAAGRAPSSAAARQHLRERAERMEPGEHPRHFTGTSSSAVLGSLIQRAPTPSRQPRRDWASEEARKREERNNSIATGSHNVFTSPSGSASNSRRPSLQIRAWSDDPSGLGVGYHSAGDGNTTGDDDEDLAEEDMTALPSISSHQRGNNSGSSLVTRGSSSAGNNREGSRGGERDKKVLLKDMIFKKRRGPG